MRQHLPLPGPFWLIGCGNMAGAMLEGWLAKGLDPAQVTVIRPSGKPVATGIRVLTRLPEDEVPALVMLGTKPQKLAEIVPELAGALEPETTLISILAGVEQATLRARFPAPRNVIRAMPNLPVRLNKGVIGLHADSVEPHARAAVETLMATLGRAEWLDTESEVDLVTALGGSGPAFLCRFIDALAAAGAALGLPEKQAASMALAMVEGAAAMAAASPDSPAALADKVASPRGTTRAGLDVLDADRALDALVERTLRAAADRATELAAEARAG